MLDEKYGVVRTFNTILEGNDVPFIEQIFSFYANVAGDSIPWRDYVLQSTTVLNCACKLVTHNKISRTLLRAISWMASNLARGKKLTNSFDVSV